MHFDQRHSFVASKFEERQQFLFIMTNKRKIEFKLYWDIKVLIDCFKDSFSNCQVPQSNWGQF